MSEALRRFFVPRDAIRARNVTLSGELAHRLARVLRLKRGDRVVLAAGSAREYTVQLTTVYPHAVTGIVVGEQDAPPEPAVSLVLYQSLIRANRFDLVLEKGAEVGVSRFVPVIAARTQVQEEPSAARADRWRRLVVEAAEQCGRGRLPQIEAPLPFEQAIRSATGLRLVAWEDQASPAIPGISSYVRRLSERPRTVSLFIGPEGGFEPQELAVAQEAGAGLVTLGRRVMRSETAAIVASALILNALEEPDG